MVERDGGKQTERENEEGLFLTFGETKQVSHAPGT
jgi:hypothetical protein